MVLLNLNYKQLKPDIIIFDERSGQNANNFFPLTPAEVTLLSEKLARDKKYQLKKVKGVNIYFSL